MQRVIPTLTCALLLLAHAGCANVVALTGSRAAPGARGEIKVSRGDNGNSRITVRVEHLALPQDVVEGSKAYVVWVQNTDHVAPQQNVGELRVDADLEGHLATLTTLTQFDLTITPETSAQVAQPAGQPILSARINRVD